MDLESPTLDNCVQSPLRFRPFTRDCNFDKSKYFESMLYVDVLEVGDRFDTFKIT